MKDKNYITLSALSAVAVLFLGASGAMAAGDPERGKKAFLTCVSCHSAEPGLHKTGPSLANIFSKKAGTIESFGRYSEVIKKSGIVWNDKTLDSWMRDPQSLIPGTLMKIRGLDKATERQDIIAYLKQLASGSGRASTGAETGVDPADLSDPPPGNQVTALNHCRNTYHLKMATGETIKYWEFNIRFKADTSTKGPPKGRPVLIGGGMRGDRASLVFASAAEISPFIKEKC